MNEVMSKIEITVKWMLEIKMLRSSSQNQPDFHYYGHMYVFKKTQVM